MVLKLEWSDSGGLSWSHYSAFTIIGPFRFFGINSKPLNQSWRGSYDMFYISKVIILRTLESISAIIKSWEGKC